MESWTTIEEVNQLTEEVNEYVLLRSEMEFHDLEQYVSNVLRTLDPERGVSQRFEKPTRPFTA